MSLIKTENNEFSMEENTQVVPVIQREGDFVVQLTEQKSISYCSYKPKTHEEKVSIFNAVNNATKRIKECVNMELKIKHVFVEVVELVNEKTGEFNKCPRTVLIDENGEGYCAVSIGVFNSLRKIFELFGKAENWKTPLTIVPKVVSKGNKQITTLTVK